MSLVKRANLALWGLPACLELPGQQVQPEQQARRELWALQVGMVKRER